MACPKAAPGPASPAGEPERSAGPVAAAPSLTSFASPRSTSPREQWLDVRSAVSRPLGGPATAGSTGNNGDTGNTDTQVDTAGPDRGPAR
eukprot:3705392-Lingulodinium_polyedra.AAC.1